MSKAPFPVPQIGASWIGPDGETWTVNTVDGHKVTLTHDREHTRAIVEIALPQGAKPPFTGGFCSECGSHLVHKGNMYACPNCPPVSGTS